MVLIRGYKNIAKGTIDLSVEPKLPKHYQLTKRFQCVAKLGKFVCCAQVTVKAALNTNININKTHKKLTSAKARVKSIKSQLICEF